MNDTKYSIKKCWYYILWFFLDDGLYYFLRFHLLFIGTLVKLDNTNESFEQQSESPGQVLCPNQLVDDTQRRRK